MFFLEFKSGFGYFTLSDGFIYFELFFEASDVLPVSFLCVLGQVFERPRYMSRQELETDTLGQRFTETLGGFLGLVSQTVFILAVKANCVATSIYTLGELGSLETHYSVAEVADNLLTQDTEL